MKATRILLFFGLGFLALVFFVGIYLVPKLQAGNESTARQSDAARVSLSDVYVDVTYASPEFVKRVKLEKYLERWNNRAQPFLTGVNTHVGTIAELGDLQSKILIEDSNGDRFPSLGSPIVLSEHHNMYLLVFPLVDNYGKPIFSPARKSFRLIVSGVGKTAERVFEWKLPVIEHSSTRALANTLMLVLGVIGSLMVILSPCAIELTSYYTGIIAGIVGSACGVEKAGQMPALLRMRILRNLTAFVAGFTILYTASGATVALLGQKLLEAQAAMQRKADSEDLFCAIDSTNQVVTPVKASLFSRSGDGNHEGHSNHGAGFGGWTRYANWLGAAFLVYFALKSAGWISGGGQCFVWLAKGGRKFRSAIAWIVGLVSPKRAFVIRAPSLALRQAESITPVNSFCAGLGLSVSCLTCMGGAILYPLLIFVGTSTWYWGAMILGTYSLALAVPMAAIAMAVGNFTFQSEKRRWMIKGLQYTSAIVMIAVAVLIAFDRTRFINHVVFTVLSAFGGSANTGLGQI
jgi:cytochrome c biogenesis protein CcdA